MAGYALTAELIYRGLCLVNLVAFVSFYVQFKGLCASGGLAPTSEFMKKVRTRFSPSIMPPYPSFSMPSSQKEKEKDKESEPTKREQPLEKANIWYAWAGQLRRNITSRAYAYPTLFWLSASDPAHYAVFTLGMGSAILGFFGFGWAPINLMICMICYLSFHVVGQPWLGLQMHVTLLESDMVFSLGCLAAYTSWTLQRIFSYSTGLTFASATYSPFVAVFLMRFLVWRIMLGCGACKYGTGDRTWRDLTAMDFHYFTQPLPNPLSYFMASLPHRAHAIAVIATHLVEGPLTFLAFGNWLCRALAFLLFAGLNVGINVTGNYGYLGLLTVVEAVSVLDDDILQAVIPRFLIPHRFLYHVEPSFTLFDILFIPALTLPYLFTSLLPLISTFHGHIPFYSETVAYFTRAPLVGAQVPRIDATLRDATQKALRSDLAKKTIFRVLDKCEVILEYVHPFHVINRYAKFGSMTTKRWELIIEGSADAENWREFEFKYKVGNPNKRPAFCPLHLPGIDWQIWFLPTGLASGSRAGWFWKLVEAILLNKKPVLDLLEPSPFGDAAPKYIRVKIYDYKFCFDKENKDGVKKWWNREYVGPGGGVLTLEEGKMIEILPRGMQGR